MQRSGIMILVARWLLGLLFAVMGLNGFLNFMPQPSAPMPASVAAFLGALAATGYMIPLISATELVAGLLLLGDRFVPLALLLLAPVLVHIAAYHIFLAPMMAEPAVVAWALELYLAWIYRAAFAQVLAARS